MSTVVNSTKGKRFDMTKKIQKNPKYEHIKSSLDTGASMSKYMAKVEEIKENYKFRKDEIFKRMKITTFAQLIIQVNRLALGDDYDDIPPTPSSNRPDTADREVQHIQQNFGPSYGGDTMRSDTSQSQTQRSTLQSVAMGFGEMDLNKQEPAQQIIQEDCPFLLLDVRDLDDYEMCHIISAHSYPKANLSRAQNFESREMLKYRNKTGAIIVLYDECENIAPNVVTTLVQRGYDNLFMLSGGLKVAAKVFPQSLVTGTLPPSITQQKPREFLPASQKAFTSDDIDALEMQLDSALEDKSTATKSTKSFDSISSHKPATDTGRLSKPSSRTSRAQDSRASSRAPSNASHVHHGRPFVP